MIKECVQCGKLFDAKRAAKTCGDKCSKERLREYRQSPEYKAYHREYKQRPEVKEYHREYHRENNREYMREYRQRPEVKERKRDADRNRKAADCMSALRQAVARMERST